MFGDSLRAQHRATRDAAAEGLGAGHDVRFDCVRLNREEVAAAAHARLHLVGDQQYAMAPRAVTQRGQELVRQVIGTGHALHGLDDHGGDVRTDHSFCSRAIIAGNKVDRERCLRKPVPFL